VLWRFDKKTPKKQTQKLNLGFSLSLFLSESDTEIIMDYFSLSQSQSDAEIIMKLTKTSSS
jgi:hypothetical protein